MQLSIDYATLLASVLCAHIHPSYRRIVIRHLRSKLRPRIDMDVLVFDFLCNRVRHKHVVKLLRIHIEQICVALDVVNLICRICILKP